VFNIRFPGQYFDAETGLHYNRFRYYDPEVGRYVSADPIGQAGAGDENLYRYVWNNPSNLADLLGLGGPGSGFAGHGSSFANPGSGPSFTGTDAERAKRQKALGRGLSAIAAGGGVGGALAKGPVPPQARLGLAGIGLIGLLLTNDPSLDPDGDNDNDGIPDVVDPDDDNDLIPDEYDPDPLISCDFGGEACSSPLNPPKNSCEPGDAP
jgi:RHS repeat-associated protein